MSEIPFYKMEASSNDFVVIDNRKQKLGRWPLLARLLCDRHTGIGSDGVLLIESSRKADFKMRILNADGSEAEMCGNGSRCVARFAREILKFQNPCLVETLAGIIQAHVKRKTVKVRLSDPRDFGPDSILEVDGRPLRYRFLNTGVPHVVLFVGRLRHFPVSELGEKIRYHARFKPAGTNVNFVQVTGLSAISVRTYERGVGETQACGTGVTASAIVSVLLGKVKSPVKVETLGGEMLTVTCRAEGRRVTEVYLEGGAHFVYRGVWLGANSRVVP